MIQQPITGYLRPADLAALQAIKARAETIRAIVAQVAAEAGVEGNPTLKGDDVAVYRSLAWSICAGRGFTDEELAAVSGARLEVVRDSLRRSAGGGDEVSAVLQSVCDQFAVTLDDLRGPGRSQRVNEPRKVAYRRLRDLGLSLPRIGAIMGGRDHTTVMHGLRAAQRGKA